MWNVVDYHLFIYSIDKSLFCTVKILVLWQVVQGSMNANSLAVIIFLIFFLSLQELYKSNFLDYMFDCVT